MYYVESGKIGRVPDPNILSAPTSNRRLSLSTVGIVPAAISSKTGFTKLYASRGGWVCYAQDFLKAWLRCDLIIGTSSGVPIKRGAVKAISAATPLCKGKEKKIKQEAVKRAKLEESAEATEAGPETKKRKTLKSQKQLVISKGHERVGPSTIRKEVGHPLILRTQVKTRVESSLSQVRVCSSAQGSLGSFDFIRQSPLGPSGRTCSREKTIRESVERERERQGFFPSFLFYFSSSLFLLCLSLSLLTNEWSFLPCSPNASQTPREARVSHLVMMFASILFQCYVYMHSFVCFHLFKTFLCILHVGD